MRYYFSLLSLVLLFPIQSVWSLIFLNGDNLRNLLDPGNGAPWDEVAHITNPAGTHRTSGSAVHLGGGYMITANHVNLGQGYVSFDGTTTYQIRTGSSVRVTSGSDIIDLKVFQLTRNPGTQGVDLFPEGFMDMEGNFGPATHISWGVGRDTSDTSNPWTWGGSSTVRKRWGTNRFELISFDNFGRPRYGFRFPDGGTEELLVTGLDVNSGPNEAAATLYDSGSGLFLNVSGNWFLAGVLSTVSSVAGDGTSSFGIGNTSDFNFSVRIAEYADEISSLLTDPIPVPESSAFTAIAGMLALGARLMNRRGV